MLKYRILTIAVLIPLVWYLLFNVSISYKRGVILLLMLWAWWEWRGLALPLSLPKQVLSFSAMGVLAVVSHHPTAQIYILGLGTLFWLFVAPCWLVKRWQPSAFLNLIIGSGLIVSLFSAIAYLVHKSPAFLLASMALIWVSDIMAYVTGRLLGRHKLAPEISPGKTWEGALGGILFSALYTSIIFLYFGASLNVHTTNLTLGQYPLFWLFLFSILLAAYGIIGDLFESLLKRQAGKKDSGTLLPGHGGILDRIDALFPVLPMIALLCVLGIIHVS
ncbi:MAG: phosphatidate cytidylyltransferase [Pseudomonadota bacterium]